MARRDRTVDKFSCETSRFLLPTFRRPAYREIKDMDVQPESEKEIFSRWSKEDEQYYHVINTALLNDAFDILKKNAQFINNLRRAIRENNNRASLKVYRGLTISNENARQEYKIGVQFLWPTFSSTSKNKDKAHHFGDYMFEIETAPDDWTYRADISQYSVYPEEEEVLFYLYSGFVVKDIIPDARIIRLKCVDTLKVEKASEKHIPEQVKLFDSSRNMFVFLHKKNSDIHWCYTDRTDEMFLIGQNPNGYWDAPYRYHHRNGYFVDKGENIWEEYQKDQLGARFTRVPA